LIGRVAVVKKTDFAILVECWDARAWVPRSQILGISEVPTAREGDLHVKEWYADKVAWAFA
jgi:hypothetical protein